MESTIKQSEEDRNRSLEGAKRLYEDYKCMKEQVDIMRSKIGLEKLSDITDEEEHITPE